MRDPKFKLTIRGFYHEKYSLCNLGDQPRSVPIALETADILPVESKGTSSDPRNVLLLCCNHRALFDSYAWVFVEDFRFGIWGAPTFHQSVAMNRVLRGEGQRLENLPDAEIDHPVVEAIWFRLNL